MQIGGILSHCVRELWGFINIEIDFNEMIVAVRDKYLNFLVNKIEVLFFPLENSEVLE